MNHSFNVEIAARYGLPEAIIYNNLEHWCKKNQANNMHVYDNKAYTYNTQEAFSVLFSYLTQRRIQTALTRLKDEGLIEVRNDISPDKWDKTNWYHCVTKSVSIDDTINVPSTVQNLHHHDSTDINTDINTHVTPSGVDEKVQKEEETKDTSTTKKGAEKKKAMIEATRIAEYLEASLQASLEKYKPRTSSQIYNWAKDIELLIRLDGVTSEEVIRVIDWIHKGKGGFWRSNIMSGNKLRKQFVTLWDRASQDAPKPPNTKERILAKAGIGKVFFDYPDKDLNAQVSVCIYGEYNSLYDYHRNKYLSKEKAQKVWQVLEQNIEAVLARIDTDNKK